MIAGRFEGRVAIVTGAAGGIGSAVARRLHGEGASVVLADRTAPEALAAELGARAIGIPCDVGDEAAVEACAHEAMREFGRIDVIVNNAAIMTFTPLAECTADEWLAVLRVNLLGAAFFTRQAFRHMGSAGGAIVNVASIHALATSAETAPYAASKAALLSLTRSTAIEGRDRRIRANAVLPGAIDTPMLWDNPNVKSGAETIDLSDVGAPADVAAAVAYLASEDAAFVTGTTLTVDGGRMASL